MKSFKLVALSVILTLSVFSLFWFNSCSKDGCKGVTCLNYGRCGGGVCQCDSGLGGSNCEIVYRRLYSNTYLGTGNDDSGHIYANNTLAFSEGTDTTNFNNMELTWTNPGAPPVVFSGIILSNNLSSGSNFVVINTTTTPDSFTYSGGGSVNGNVASLTLTKSHRDSTPVIITLNNFNKQ